MNDDIPTGFNVDTIKKTQITEAQEKMIKTIELAAKDNSLNIDLESLIPLRTNAIVKTAFPKSNILVPGNKSGRGKVAWTKIYKLSRRAQEEFPELKPGIKVLLNVELSLNIAGGYFVSTSDNEFEYIYYKVDANQIDCAYNSLDEKHSEV